LHICPPSSRRSSEPAGCRRRGSAPAPPPADIQLLTEIRDLLKDKK
jgi:large-conductance mechanosensitive channel